MLFVDMITQFSRRHKSMSTFGTHMVFDAQMISEMNSETIFRGQLLSTQVTLEFDFMRVRIMMDVIGLFMIEAF